MKTLFIGGSHDGERLEVETNRPILLPASDLRFSIPQDTDVMVTEKVETHRYEPVRLCDADGTEYVVFRYSDDPLNAIARLIKGYCRI